MATGPIKPEAPQTPQRPSQSPRKSAPQSAHVPAQFQAHVAKAQDALATNDAAVAGQQQKDPVARSKSGRDDGARRPAVTAVEGATLADMDQYATDDSLTGKKLRRTRSEISSPGGPALPEKRADDGVAAGKEAAATQARMSGAQDARPDDRPEAKDRPASDGAQALREPAGTEPAKTRAVQATEEPAKPSESAALARPPAPPEGAKLAALAESLQAAPAEDAGAALDAGASAARVTSYRAGLERRDHLRLAGIVTGSLSELFGELAVHLREDRGWLKLMEDVLPTVLAQMAQRPVVLFETVDESQSVRPVRMFSGTGQTQIDLPTHEPTGSTFVPANSIRLLHLGGDKYADVTVEGGKFAVSSRPGSVGRTFYEVALRQIGEPGRRFEGRDLRHLLAQFIEENQSTLSKNDLLAGRIFSHMMIGLLAPDRRGEARPGAQFQQAGPQQPAGHPASDPVSAPGQQLFPPHRVPAAVPPAMRAGQGGPHAGVPAGGGTLPPSVAQLLGRRQAQTGPGPVSPQQVQPATFGPAAQPAYPGGAAGAPMPTSTAAGGWPQVGPPPSQPYQRSRDQETMERLAALIEAGS